MSPFLAVYLLEYYGNMVKNKGFSEKIALCVKTLYKYAHTF